MAAVTKNRNFLSISALLQIKMNSNFNCSYMLEWRADLSDTILKGTHPRTIPARFGLIWFRGFRGEDLNVKVYDVRRRQVMAKAHMVWWAEKVKTKCI
jgi:hypothetical protein